MTEATPGLGDIVKAPRDPGTFDVWNPANVSPLVAYLATEGCPLTGRVLFVQGGHVHMSQPWTMTTTLEKDDPLNHRGTSAAPYSSTATRCRCRADAGADPADPG